MVTSFSVESWIQLRYARTHVESTMKNPSLTTAQAVEFQMVLPTEAFISNFSIILAEGGPEYVAEVKGAAEATQLYEEAVSTGQGAAIVEQDTRNARLFRVAINLEPGTGVHFRLTYEELLQRTQGRYEHIVYAGSPGQAVDNYTIVVHIDESLPLLSLSVEDPLVAGNNNLLNEEDFLSEEGEQKTTTTSDGSRAEIRRDIDGDASRAEVRFQPTRKAQEVDGGPRGLSGELVVSYDVDRKDENNEIQVVDGYFVHFFTPASLPVLPKHVTFVLDVSGSMDGEKMQQLKDAMFTILNDLGEKDFFSLIIFSSRADRWAPDDGEDFGGESAATPVAPMAATSANRKRAITHILELEANGDTNINEALLLAVRTSGAVATSGQLPSDVQSLVIFLTDGQPTQGVTDKADIRQNIRTSNKAAGTTTIPIYSIAFGRDADFGLVKAISEEAAGAFARQIYEGSDAALQLEDFYALIASPLLAQLKFVYLGENAEVNNQSLSVTHVGNLFQGGEFVVAGQIDQLSGSNKNSGKSRLTVQVEGIGAEAKIFSDQLSICMPPVEEKEEATTVSSAKVDQIIENCRPLLPLPPRSESQNFLKRLHAFLNIRQLLKSDSEPGRERAKLLALENNFVTEVTSLLVRRPDGGQELAAPSKVRTPDRDFIGSASFQSSHNILFSAVAEYDDFESDFPSTTHRYFASTRRPSTDNDERPTSSWPTTPVTPAVSCGVAGDSSQLTLYTATYYRAENVTLTDSLADLSGGPGAQAVSARLTGACCWLLYAEASYAGQSVRLEPGTAYKSATSLGSLLQNVASAEKKDCTAA